MAFKFTASVLDFILEVVKLDEPAKDKAVIDAVVEILKDLGVRTLCSPCVCALGFLPCHAQVTSVADLAYLNEAHLPSAAKGVKAAVVSRAKVCMC